MNILKSTLRIGALALLISPAFAQHATRAVAKSDAPQAVRGKSDSSSALPKLEGRYVGLWVTTWNKKLDGTTNCIVQQLADDRWQGRFWGIWQQVPFDYTVVFERAKPKQGKSPKPEEPEQIKPPEKPASEKALVTGKATIDGASYDWQGVLTPNEFKIKFTGSRYEGQVDMARAKEKQEPASKVAAKDNSSRKK